jgi:hypothetical protein
LGVTVWGHAADFHHGVLDERLAGKLRIVLGQILTMSMLNARSRSRAKEPVRARST